MSNQTVDPTAMKWMWPGYLAMAATVLIWASFALTARATGASALAFADVAFIRAAIPALMLLPLVPGRWSMIRKTPVTSIVLIALGAGAPFFFLASMGGAATSAAHVATVIAGTVPIFVAVILWVQTGDTPPKGRILGLCVIIVGVLVLLAAQGAAAQTQLVGMGLLLGASLLWSVYTIAFKNTELDPMAGLIVFAVPSALVLGGLIAFDSVASNIGAVTWADALPFILIQGFAVSLASLTFAFAIRRLGPGLVTTIGSLTPVVTAFLAIPILGEPLTVLIGVAIGLICLGVYQATKV